MTDLLSLPVSATLGEGVVYADPRDPGHLPFLESLRGIRGCVPIPGEGPWDLRRLRLLWVAGGLYVPSEVGTFDLRVKT